MNRTFLMSRTALCSAVFGATLAVAAPAYGQTQPVTENTNPCVDANGQPLPNCTDSQGNEVAAPENEGEAASGDIVVVGSLLRRNQFNTADNIQVINRDEATQAGFNSTADILQSTAVTGGTPQINNAFGGFVTAGGPGANTVSLRGLGTTRTLTLLNGRRISPAGSRGQVGAADLNVLPTAMIDRVEILNTGASSIYGSDAVAGVINVVTRNNINGLILEGQANVPQVGAGVSTRLAAVFGYRNDRLNVAGSLEYLRRNELTLGDREFTLCQTSNRFDGVGGGPDSGSFIDPRTGQARCYPTGVTGEGGVSINVIATRNYAGNTVALAPGIPAGYTGVCNRFRPNAAVTTGALPGFECVGGGTLSVNIRDTTPRGILANALISPVSIYTGYLQGAYETGVLGNMEIYAEFLATRRDSDQLQNRQFTIDYAQGSPLIPALLAGAGPALGPQPDGVTQGQNVGIRVFADYGNYSNRQTVDFVRGVVGVRGELFGSWRYDAYLLQAWSDATYSTDLILTDRLTQSLDVVPATGGGFRCRDITGGCVAAPSVSPAVIGGQFPADWFDYVTDPVTGNTKFRETIAQAVVSGPLFNLPGGQAQAAIGVEYRKSEIDDTPGSDSIRGNTLNFTSSTPTRGTDSVKEIFGEVEFPLLADVPFAHDLTINASGRYTEYESYGGQETYKIGARWAPIRAVAFRGSYGTSFRAPALFEQFLGSTSGFQSSSSDPCNNLGAAGQNPVRVANCQTEGLPLGFIATNGITVLQRGGAESGLSAETSTAYTFGGVLQPDFGSGFGALSLSADYFNVEVENGVSQLGFGTILSQCYDDPTFKANSICALIVRAPNNALTVTTGYVNVATARVSGWDFNFRYSRELLGGNFRLSAALTKFNERFNQNLPTDAIRNVIGSLTQPEWTGSFDANFGIGAISLRYGIEWIQGTNEQINRDIIFGVGAAPDPTYDFDVEDYFLHSASVRFRQDRFEFLVGVRNLFDTDPEEVSSGAYNRVGNSPLYSGYDYVGRTFFVNVTTRF